MDTADLDEQARLFAGPTIQRIALESAVWAKHNRDAARLALEKIADACEQMRDELDEVGS